MAYQDLAEPRGRRQVVVVITLWTARTRLCLWDMHQALGVVSGICFEMPGTYPSIQGP